jgi:hypothetical protein
MYFLIFGILQNFTPKMLEIAFLRDSRFQNHAPHYIAGLTPKSYVFGVRLGPPKMNVTSTCKTLALQCSYQKRKSLHVLLWYEKRAGNTIKFDLLRCPREKKIARVTLAFDRPLWPFVAQSDGLKWPPWSFIARRLWLPRLLSALEQIQRCGNTLSRPCETDWHSEGVLKSWSCGLWNVCIFPNSESTCVVPKFTLIRSSRNDVKLVWAIFQLSSWD